MTCWQKSIIAIALACILSACSTGGFSDLLPLNNTTPQGIQEAQAPTPITPEPVIPAQPQRSVFVKKTVSPVIPPELYQPTLHVILALQGGVGNNSSATTLHTTWQRQGDDASFKLLLQPNETTVVALNPGQYHLVSATDGAGTDFVNKPGMKLRNMVLDPGQVRYGGKVLMRMSKVKAKGSTKKKPIYRNLVSIKLLNKASLAKARIREIYPLRATRMRTRFLKVIK